MGITVLKYNVPWGPFSRGQVEEGLKRGDFTLKYLAHTPGLKEWLPLGEVLHFLDVGASLPPVPASELPSVPAIPPLPGAMPVFPPNPVQPPPLAIRPPTLPAANTPLLPPSIPAPEIQHKPAPFIRRGMAFLFDCGLLFVPITLLFGLGALGLEVQGLWNHTDAESARQGWLLLKRNFQELMLLVALGIGWLYGAGLECSPWQATVGKRWMGLHVTDAQGKRLGFLQASGRHAAKYLSALPCFLGFIAALFSSRGLALHDRLAGTRVVRDENHHS